MSGDKAGMTKTIYFATDYYDRHVIQRIIDKYGLAPMDAARNFLQSKTHAMLEDADYGLMSFSEKAIFDMWEAERVTGNPGNSVYVRGE